MSMPDLLTPQEISNLARSLSRIESLDMALERMAKKAAGDDPMLAEIGNTARGAIGRNHLPLFTDERLGEIVVASVINALRYERDLLARDVDGFVLVPTPAVEPVELSEIWAKHEKGAQ